MSPWHWRVARRLRGRDHQVVIALVDLEELMHLGSRELAKTLPGPDCVFGRRLGLLGHRFDLSGSLRLYGRSLPWLRPPGRRPGVAAAFQDPRAALNPLVRLDRQLVPA